MTPKQTTAEIQHSDSIARVDPGEWDRMASGRVLHSWGWLRALEAASPRAWRWLYFAARSGDGLLGAVVARLQEPGQAGATLDELLYNDAAPLARRIGASLLPALVCGAPMGLASPLVLRADLDAAARAAVCRGLLAAIEQAAADNGWSVVFRDVVRASRTLAPLLASRGYVPSAELPVACLPITWDRFDGYVAQLRATHRWAARNVRRELAAASRHALVIEALARPGEHEAVLHRLLDEHYRRRNARPFPRDSSFLNAVKSNLGDRAVVYAARVAGRIAGVALGLADANAVHMLTVGVEPDAGRHAALFGNLCYNRPIADATARGCARIYYGRMLYEYKMRRGCALVDSDIYIRIAGRIRPHLLPALFRYRSRRMEARTAALPRVGAAPPDTRRAGRDR
jgi:predicted N-acyltransferase